MNRCYQLGWFLIVSFFIFYVSPIKAERNIQSGLRFGVNLSQLHGDIDTYYPEINSNTDLNFGIFGESSFLGDIYIHVEAAMSWKGASTKDEKLRIVYLELPFLLKYAIGFQKHNSLYLTTGVAPALNLYTGYEKGRFSTAATKYMSVYDIGMVFGAGVDYRIVNFRGFVEVKYTLGLTSLDTIDESSLTNQPEQDLDITNQALTFSFGVFF